jgi:hypothetical protein
VKLRVALGPVGGARKFAGPRGGDLGIGRGGDRSRGTDFVESLSLSLYASCVGAGGERSRGGDRGRGSRGVSWAKRKRSG